MLKIKIRIKFMYLNKIEKHMFNSKLIETFKQNNPNKLNQK